MREETFGPVTPILAIDSLEEAVDGRQRLALRALRVHLQPRLRGRDADGRRPAFGEIYINRTLGESVHAHHAGFRESGIGGEDGKWGLLRYTQIKTAYHHYG